MFSLLLFRTPIELGTQINEQVRHKKPDWITYEINNHLFTSSRYHSRPRYTVNLVVISWLDITNGPY